jgi:hypothetical protein
MYTIFDKILQYGFTKTHITSEWRIFSLNQTYIIVQKLFSYIILSSQTILFIILVMAQRVR